MSEDRVIWLQRGVLILIVASIVIGLFIAVQTAPPGTTPATPLADVPSTPATDGATSESTPSASLSSSSPENPVAETADIDPRPHSDTDMTASQASSSPPTPSTVSAASPAAESQVMVTTEGYLHLRSGPSASTEQIGTVPFRTTLTVLGRDRTGQWIFIDYDGTQGWIAAWLCEIAGDLDSAPVTDGSASAVPSPVSSPPAAPPETVGPVMATARDELSIREGPGTEYTEVSEVPPGATVTVTGRDSAARWILIDYNGMQGWIAGWYCEIAGNLASVPVVTPTTTPATTAPTAAPTSPPAPPPSPSPAVEGIVPSNLVLTDAVLSNIRSIYRRGLSYGNDPHAFSRAGDCETMSELFLRPIGRHEYDLGEFGYLQGVIDYYFDSYAYIGYASHEGFTAGSIMDPLWADPSVCQSGESPLACEYRLHRPVISLILLRTQSADAGPGSQYYYDMRAVVELTLQRGIIPVISTGPYQAPPLPPVEPMNDSIRQVAAEYNIPLWDFWQTTEMLLYHGIDDSNHLTWMHQAAYFYLPYIDKAMTHRNLEALQILYTLTTQVTQ